MSNRVIPLALLCGAFIALIACAITHDFHLFGLIMLIATVLAIYPAEKLVKHFQHH